MRWRSVCLTLKLPQVCTHCGRDANTFWTIAIVVQQAMLSLCLNIQATSIQCSRFSRRIRGPGEFTSYSTTPGRLLILGDFNLHLDDPTSPSVTRLNILHSTGLVQRVKQPMHKSNHTLDIVISRSDDTMLTSSVVTLPNTFSDHHTITLSIKGFTPRPTTHKCRGRDYRRIDLNNFQADLYSELSSCIACDGESVDTIVQKYSDSVSSTLDSHAPIVTRNPPSKTSQPWLDDSILDMRRKRRALERKWRHTGLEIDKQIYTSQIDSVKLHIREAKCSYYNAALNNANTKATFQVLNSLTKPNEQKLPAHENDNIMCVAFAELLCSHCYLLVH